MSSASWWKLRQSTISFAIVTQFFATNLRLLIAVLLRMLDSSFSKGVS